MTRIGECYHRFHSICLYRDMFMKRHIEKDEFGGIIEFKIHTIKKCPICRSVISLTDVEYVRLTVNKYP